MRATLLVTVSSALVGFASAALLASCVGDPPSASIPDAGGDDVGSAPEASGQDVAASSDAGGDATVTDAPPSDAAPDAGDAADAHPFTPADLGAKVVLWLEADPARMDFDDAGMLAVWHDRSSFAASASAAGVLPPPEAGTVNGQPVVQFAWNTNLLDVPNGQQFFWGTRDFAIFVVVRDGTGGAGSSMTLWSKNANGMLGQTALLSFDIGGSGYVHASVKGDGDAATDMFDTANPVMADKAYHVLGLRRAGQDRIEIRTDGTAEAFPLTPADLDIGVANTVHFGGMPNPPVLRGWDVEVAEIIAISSTSGVLTASDIQSVEAYFKTKYATP